MTHVVTHVKAMTVGLALAIGAQVAFTVCEFLVKYAFSVAMNGGVGASPGASLAIPSPLSVVAGVIGFVYGYRWTLQKSAARRALTVPPTERRSVGRAIY